VVCVKWLEKGSHVSISQQDATNHLYDITRKKAAYCVTVDARCVAIDFNNHVMTMGTKSGRLYRHDIRQHPRRSLDVLHVSDGQICKVAWNPQGSLLAVGINDNVVRILDHRVNRVLHEMRHHKAAVKAIAFAPDKHCMLVTGGGMRDHTLRYCNALLGSCISYVDTTAQITNAAFSADGSRIVTTHGYQNNSICVWNAASLTRLGYIENAHSGRVLYLATGSNETEELISTGGADTYVRIWKVFEKQPKKRHDVEIR